MAPSDEYINPFIEVELQEGGSFRIGFLSAEGDQAVAAGKYLIIDRPKKLAFSWYWEQSPDFEPGETMVTVEFFSSDVGTELVLTHDRFPTEEMLSRHSDGWSGALNRLQLLMNE